MLEKLNLESDNDINLNKVDDSKILKYTRKS